MEKNRYLELGICVGKNLMFDIKLKYWIGNYFF